MVRLHDAPTRQNKTDPLLKITSMQNKVLLSAISALLHQALMFQESWVFSFLKTELASSLYSTGVAGLCIPITFQHL